MSATDEAREVRDARKIGTAAARAAPETNASYVSQIEAQFEAAQRAPVHCRNRDLVAVDVMPLLPDSDLWVNDYSVTSCESALLMASDTPRATEAQRVFLRDHALLKPYNFVGTLSLRQRRAQVF